ncbi:tetraprenyl-beta-curcumene synthase family protein [Anaeroselena agilis]|uniref:Tetraprenyl-beta-curcumene synthase family protein n=1 Tax=Anaeroselena agilis TaxID=3063788 RepID=A0ABU3P3B3_9FIRM|nr:tetraprenyl-beta-curcumene synthase family protein [Selenomonadales bacterium 4137-cl]
MASLLTTANSLNLIRRFVNQVFPLVDRELSYWRHRAAGAEPELAVQALASIRDKRFHCQGGAIYSLYPGVNTSRFVRLIVALQTISDYLDNLCDRAGVADEAAFRQLHLAMTDALDPDGEPRDYYLHYPLKDDGGYLAALVAACREETARLPAYGLVKPAALKLAGLYSELQIYKHLDPAVREAKMLAWGERHLAAYPGVTLWEFAAATGSTLGMFMLCALAANPDLTAAEAEATCAAYFPWICGLHILLDYYIDLAEDHCHGDLNFVAYYRSPDEIVARLTIFWRQALEHAGRLTQPGFTTTVVHGLLAMYLSDPKTQAPLEKRVKAALLDTAGGYARLLHNLCRLLRRQGIL